MQFCASSWLITEINELSQFIHILSPHYTEIYSFDSLQGA